jgi:hypothetical protein
MLVFFAVVFIPVLAHSQTPDQSENLRGLSGVYVEPLLGQAAVIPGIDEAGLKEDVDRMLRTERVPLVSSQQATDMPGSPLLIMHIDASMQDEYYIYYMELMLMEGSTLQRTGKEYPATTWLAYYFGIVPADEAKEQIRETAGKLVTRFAQDYHKANN